MALQFGLLNSVYGKLTVAFKNALDLFGFDTQISGVQDDGSAEGVIRSKIISGDLVKIPASMVNWISAGSMSTGVTRYIGGNADGSWSQLTVPVPDAYLKNTVVKFTFFGRTLGIRVRSKNTFPNVTIVIDGEAYPLVAPLSSYVSSERESLFIVATDLSRGIHHASIILNYSPDSSVSMAIYGILVERGAGYRESQSMDYPYFDGTLTTAIVSIPTVMADNYEPVSALKEVRYHNISNADCLLTISYDAIVIQEVILTPAGTNGSSFVLKCGDNGWALGTGDGKLGYNHKAAAGSAITYKAFVSVL